MVPCLPSSSHGVPVYMSWASVWTPPTRADARAAARRARREIDESVIPFSARAAFWVRARSELGARGAAAAQAGLREGRAWLEAQGGRATRARRGMLWAGCMEAVGEVAEGRTDATAG